MTDIVNEFFHRHYPADLSSADFEFTTMLGGMLRCVRRGVNRIFPRMTCRDGFSMSVQGHAGAYSYPRNDFAAEYFEVEVGFPAAVESSLSEYQEPGEDPLESVYGYVPISVVVAIIEAHGGLLADCDVQEAEARG